MTVEINHKVQYYFEPDASGQILEISPNPDKPISVLPFLENLNWAREWIENINQFGNKPLFDRVVRIWFKSKLASPPPYIKDLYKELLGPTHEGEQLGQPTIWEKVNSDLPLDLTGDDQFEEAILQALVDQNMARNANEARDLVCETLSYFLGLVGSLNEYIETVKERDFEHGAGLSEPPESVIIYNPFVNLRHAKQLVLHGIVEENQFHLLTALQKDLIYKTLVPRSFNVSRNNDLGVILKRTEEKLGLPTLPNGL